MGHKNKVCMVVQIKQKYQSMEAYGQSKHQAKLDFREGKGEGIRDKIYSYSTMKNYMKHANYFAAYCEQEHGCKTLDQCRQYVDEWLQKRIDAGLAAHTIKLESAALAKLYGCSTTEFIQTPSRIRSEITRSRGEVKTDKHFSVSKNQDFIDFCKHTGLRRSEVTELRGDQLRFDERGNTFIEVKGKGGRVRLAPILENDPKVIERLQAAGENKVWERVPKNADIHSYRADYAMSVYKAAERPLETLESQELYKCRNDLAGRVYDRQAMRRASEALGHNRIDVIAGNYLR